MKEQQIKFDPQTHAYVVAGKRVASVTQILQRVLGNHGHGTEWHMERGSAAHELYAIMGRGEDIAEYDYDDRLDPQVMAWRDWQARERPQFEACERPVYHPTLRYCGTIDAVCGLGETLVMIDYKATATQRDALQLAAYKMAWEAAGGDKIDRIASLQITEAGWRYGRQFDKRDIRGAEAGWLNVLGVYRMIEAGV